MGYRGEIPALRATFLTKDGRKVSKNYPHADWWHIPHLIQLDESEFQTLMTVEKVYIVPESSPDYKLLVKD